MDAQINPEKLEQAADELRAQWPDAKPRCGIILGSGWGDALPIEEGEELSYTAIPGLGKTGVEGHAGRLLRGHMNGMELFIFQGRRHWYEGEGWTPVILPAYLLHQAGAQTLLLTNAAGGIREDLNPGKLMVVDDHINQLGSNPLIGPHLPMLGNRFPDQSNVYDPEIRTLLLQAGADTSGTYVATSGPVFETPAEISQFRTMGADAVGMSTVPEAIVGNALGLKVGALSCICNWAAGIADHPLTHEDVNRVAAETMPRMRDTLESFIQHLSHMDH